MAKQRLATRLPDDELDSLAAAAVAASEAHREDRQTDSLGRGWLFRTDRKPIAALRVEVTGQPPKGPIFTSGISIPLAEGGETGAKETAVARVVAALDAAAADALSVAA
jgi:hypothetical protein